MYFPRNKFMIFFLVFKTCIRVQIGSAKELAEELTKISSALSSPSDDWEDHVAAVSCSARLQLSN